MEMNKIINLARAVRKNTLSTEYSMDQANDVLRKALIEANHGKETIDIRDIRDGKCSELFAIVERVITEAKHDALTEDPFFNDFVEYHNVAMGDKMEFIIPSNDLFWVSVIGSGSQAIRRQRMLGGSSITVDTSWKAIKIYEELELLLAGRVDFAEGVRKVTDSFKAQAYNDIYSAWTSALAGLTAPFRKYGTFSAQDMLAMVQHVKAANGTRNAVILGTLIGLSKVVAPYESAAQIAMDDQYNIGYVGKFLGTPKVEIAQMYAPGTENFMIDDDQVFVLPNAGNIKPIMYVTEGQALILPHAPIENNDLTQEYMIMEKTGVACRVPAGEGKFGVYDFGASA